MSARAVGWALEQPLEALPKIILVTLADCMNSETAKCVPSQEYLAKIALCSDRTVRTHLTALEEGGYITRVRRSHPATGHRLSDGYVLHLPEGSSARPTGSAAARLPEAATSREPERNQNPSGNGRARASAPVMKVAGKPIKGEPWKLTCSILDEFNSQTGKKLGATTEAGQPSEAAKRIYQRVIAWPNLGLERHREIIEKTLASQWWGDGQPSIGVVYGPKVFEENMTREPQAKRQDGRAMQAQRAREAMTRIRGQT